VAFLSGNKTSGIPKLLVSVGVTSTICFFADAGERAMCQRVMEEARAERRKKVGLHVMSEGRCDRWL